MRKHPHITHIVIFITLSLTLGLPQSALAVSKRTAPGALPLNRPEQVTSETYPVLYFAVSPDGNRLVYTSGREDFIDLWLRSADPSRVVLPQRLTSDPSAESGPAFSPDGRFVAYVGTSHDVKGDIWLLDLDAKSLETDGAKPKRLTGRETEDGGPCFSPDGRNLYFHQATTGDNRRKLVVLDLADKNREVKPLDIKGDGAFPAVSPDGQKLAFVTYRNYASGDIFLLDMPTGKVSPLTNGPYADFFPTWSPDGKYVYFSRLAFDTNGDGRIGSGDNASVFRVAQADRKLIAYPVTSPSYSALGPRAAGKRLYFLSGRSGANNCWFLDADGEIPARENADAQMELARSVSLKTPFDPYLTILSYYRVLENFNDDTAKSAEAAFRIGKIYRQIGMNDAAYSTFQIVTADMAQTKAAGELLPWLAYASIEETMVRTGERLGQAVHESDRKRIIAEELGRLEEIGLEYGIPGVSAKTGIESAALLAEAGKDADSLTSAIGLLNKVVKNYPYERELTAQAMVLKADIFGLLGSSEQVIPLYRTVAKEYADTPQWADKAVENILDIGLSDARDSDGKIKLLRKIFEDNRKDMPLLAAGALNRIGDIGFTGNDWNNAKAAYRQVLEQYPGPTTQNAAARLSLAEILYREEHFRNALDLYETEIAQRPHDDAIYHLAQAGYIRKSVASGEFLYRLGEIHSARKTFKELMDYDDAVVEAHRGYIKCAAALNNVGPVLAGYRARLEKKPEDPIALYCTALCLTYLEDKTSLEEAEKLILLAITLDGRIEYFHQTLGYVHEVLETVHKEKGRLETALESYKKAYFLNDHKNNPDNEANLLLNIGNIYYLLKSYTNAFDYYTRRAEAKTKFDNPNTEILFHMRRGESAFQARETAKAVEAYMKTLGLIRSVTDPMMASTEFDKINRFIMDRIVSPAIRVSGLENQANTLAKHQAEINRKLSGLTAGDVLPPPSPTWHTYKKGIGDLLEEQKRLFPAAVSLAKASTEKELKLADTGERLSLFAIKVGTALEFPDRLIRMEAETLDRLGLAHQENGDFETAADVFGQTFVLNRDLALVTNLPRNRRSVAYSLYLAAGNKTGEQRRGLLSRASHDFEQAIELVKEHGVIDKRAKSDGKGLVGLTLSQSLDEVATTSAAYGFTEDQEIRLAQSFISRISVELGNISTAQQMMQQQVAAYPADKPVPESDVYGMSLLYHRAGHLAAATGRQTEAFDDFEKSGNLTLRMGNPVSSAMNAANMATTFVQIETEKSPGPVSRNWRQRLEMMDKKTSRLLAEKPFAGGEPVAAWYHNSQGVNIAATRSQADLSATDDAVARMRDLQRAGVHFAKGTDLLEKKGSENLLKQRRNLALLSTLYLNRANLFEAFAGDGPEKQVPAAFYGSALDHARAGLIPELEWRALVGLGRLEDALKVLESLTALNAGCGSGEIVSVFSPLVLERIEAGEAEDGFNLAERISEIERFNRTARSGVRLSDSDKRLFGIILERMERIVRLQEDTANAKGEEKTHLLDSLKRETDLIREKTGQDLEKLPDVVRLSSDERVQEQVMILLGLAARAEDAAGIAAKAENPDDAKAAKENHQNLVGRYHEVLQAAVSNRAEGMPPGVLAFFGPEPCEAMDAMENLPEAGVLVRVFPIIGQAKKFAVFTVTPDDIGVKLVASLDAVTLGKSGIVYAAADDPAILSELSKKGATAVALSATHLVRSAANRKAFKYSLLAAPALPERTGYETVAPGSPDAVSHVNTLVLGMKTGIFAKVPTREGEVPAPYLAMEDASGMRVRLDQQLANSSGLSLALLSGAAMHDAYDLGHLFSIFGCATVILPEESSQGFQDAKSPPKETPDFAGEFAESFLDNYLSMSATDAVKVAEKACGGNCGRWTVLGYQGMTPDESGKFAEKRFKDYVQRANTAFMEKKYDVALPLFEDAIRIAAVSGEFKKYLPTLYKHARESAYLLGELNKALAHAKTLAELMEREQPDTEEHAQALLTVGMIHAGLEQNDKAVPILEEAVEMFANLEIEPKQISALENLGIVLENATEYDRALVHFRSAATLGETLDKPGVLASQYENIGRIFDMRLSQYARAIQSYEKALEIHRQMEKPQGIAQSLLNIGRCHRLLGNFPEAERHYKEALKTIGNKGENLRLEAKILIEQANNAWYQARYEEAFRTGRQCLKIASDNDFPLIRVNALNTSGLMWWTLGNYEKALDELGKALNVAKTLKIRDDEIATTLNNTGLVYREMGRYKESLGVLEQALAIDTRLRSRWAVAYDLRNMGLTKLRMGLPEEAVQLFDKALAEIRAIGNRINEAKTLLALGEAHSVLDKRAEAETAYRQALDLARQMSIRETEWRSIHGIAKLILTPDHATRAVVTDNDRQKAKELLMQAVDVIEKMRADIKIESLKENFVDNKLSVYETLVALMADMGDPVGAFEMAERSRARNFIDLLGNQKLSLKSAKDQKLYDRRADIRMRMDETEALLAQSSEETERKAYRGALDGLAAEYKDLMIEIQAENPQLSSLVSVTPLKADRLMETIEPNTALLAYYVLPDEVFCWVVRKQGMTLFRTPVGRQTLGQSILEYRRMIQNLEPLDERSGELYDWLVDPVLEAVADAKTLGIIPHGPLHYLSFATLSDGRNYLIDRFPLFYLPSASILEYTLKKRVTQKNLKVLAIGNPDLGDDALDLPFAEQEARSVGWNFDDITILTRDKATESWVTQNIGKFGIIYMASHGEFDPVNPLFSAIKLSRDSTADGNLEASEVFGLPINADMVVLSACQTGLGKVTSGDDVIGLNRAFFYAGAHTIVSTLWRVSDISTAVLIKHFYRQYATNTKAESLQKAILHVKQRYPHPGYWGAFTLVGDYY